jgi:hypothetical protein
MSERRPQRRRVLLITAAGTNHLELARLLGDGVGDLFLGLLLLGVMVAVAEHAKRARDAAVSLQDDPWEDLLALLEAEALDVEVRHADSPTVMAWVLPVVGGNALREPLQQVCDLAASVCGHLQLKLAHPGPRFTATAGGRRA